MAGSTWTQFVVSPPNPAISSTVVSPRPTQRTWTPRPSAPTNWSIVPVGRTTVVGAEGGTVVVVVVVVMVVVVMVVVVVVAEVVVEAAVSGVDTARDPEPLPHAVPLTS